MLSIMLCEDSIGYKRFKKLTSVYTCRPVDANSFKLNISYAVPCDTTIGNSNVALEG